jgi:hypothetical protein
MKKTLQHLMLGSLFAAILVVGSAASAQTKPTDATETAKPKRDWYPFYGTVAAVDARDKTVSLKKKEGERVLQTDAKTTLEQDGKPATLTDIKAGNYIHGKLHKEGGKEEYILDAKIELEAPTKGKATNHVATATAPVVAAAAATEETATNAVAKVKKKKKKAATNVDTNTPASN